MSKENLSPVVCQESLFVTLCYFASQIEVTTGPTARAYDYLKELYAEVNDHEFPANEVDRIPLKDVSSKMLYDMLDAWEMAIDWQLVKEQDKKAWLDMSRTASDIKEAAQSFEEAEMIIAPAKDGSDIPLPMACKLVEDFLNGPWVKTLIVTRAGIGKRGIPDGQETFGSYDKKNNEARVYIDDMKACNYTSRAVSIASWFADEIQGYSQYLKAFAHGKAQDSAEDMLGMEYLSDLLAGRPMGASNSTERDWAEGNLCNVTFTGVNLPGIALRVEPVAFSNSEIQYMASQIQALKEMASEAEGICATPKSVKYGNNIEIKLASHMTSLVDTSGSFQNYDLSLVNIDRPAEDLVAQIKGILEKPEDERPELISALFYGVPGSGKSQLANYIGKELGLPVMKKTYAELQSMYVGEGEKQLKEAFAEAQSQKAILLIDELDSVAGNRKNADKNYQKTFVNQLLTELDDFKGIFIATCNFEDSLDPAVLRRLFLKLKFDFMTLEQNQKCFELYFPKMKRSKLGEMLYLTPGDFKAVKEASNFEVGKLTIKRVRELLNNEVALKKKTLGEVIKAETKAGYDM